MVSDCSATFISCATLNKSFYPSVLQFPHPDQLGSTYPTGFCAIGDKASNRLPGTEKVFSTWSLSLSSSSPLFAKKTYLF